MTIRSTWNIRTAHANCLIPTPRPGRGRTIIEASSGMQRPVVAARYWHSAAELGTMAGVTRDTTIDARQEILRTASRLFQQRGYDATSMNDVAAALKLSKGGLYHHFQSKDEMLFHIMSHAMDITEERVIRAVRGVQAPEERLRMLIRLHIEVVLSVRDREITVMLHENHPLPPSLRKQINARKKDYIHFVEGLIGDVQKIKGSKGSVTPRAAALALLGMINWIYQWYKPEGALQTEHLVPQYTELFFAGAFQ
jgi:TetR/AcrR family transcriptional regulator, cholesterol catabolism regulator